MGFEYPTAQLVTVANIIMGQSPPGTTYNEIGEGLPFYQGVTDFGVRSPIRRVFCTAPTRIAESGDILLSVRAPIGRVNVATERCAIGRGLAIIRSHEPQNRTFIEFVLRAKESEWHALEGGGSVFGNAKRDDLESLKIIWPEENIRRYIASILGSLDDKIELNHEMNKTLEQMAHAIFKSWFVDFEPFQDGEFEYNEELGKEIPKGWVVGIVADLCETQYGYTESASEEKIGPLFLRITDMNKEPWINWSSVPYCKIDEKHFQKYKLNYGDVLISRMADPGKATIVEHDVEAVFASYLIRLKTYDIPTSYFLFYYLRSSDFINYAYGTSDDTTRKSMNAKVISSCKLAIPPAVIINNFYKKIEDMRKQVSINIEESSTLAQIRDALLPKLLSGEIHVNDIKRDATEEASA